MLRSSVVLGLALCGHAAHANPMSIVPGGADPDAPTIFHVTVDYAYTIDRANIQRENVGAPGTDPAGGIPVTDDLSFKQTRHTLTPRAELALLRDTYLSFAVPIVIGQARELSLDVPAGESTTIRDGLLGTDGFDARDPNTPLIGSDLIFRGHSRSGVEQLHFGLGVTPMNQRRDPTKPTWKIGGELRLAVGKVMRFDAMKTAEETGVSKGVHELKLWTSFARQFRRVEGYFDMFWMVPLTARESSLFDDIEQRPGAFGASSTMPGQKAGVSFGLEAYALDDRVNHNRISIDVGARVVSHFEGRDYSEMWEVFALAGDVRRDGPLVLDRDPVEADVQAVSHPGISNIENYLETAARFGVRAQLGKRIHFGVLVDLAWKTDHAITFADAGTDLPTCSGGRTADCETDANDLINPNTEEVSPLHVPLVDLVGHRYLSVDNFAFSIGVHAQALF